MSCRAPGSSPQEEETPADARGAGRGPRPFLRKKGLSRRESARPTSAGPSSVRPSSFRPSCERPSSRPTSSCVELPYPGFPPFRGRAPQWRENENCSRNQVLAFDPVFPPSPAGRLVSTPLGSSSLGNNSLGNLPPLIGHCHRRLDGKIHEIRPSLCPQSAALQPFLRVTLTPSANASQEISITKSE